LLYAKEREGTKISISDTGEQDHRAKETKKKEKRKEKKK